MIRTITAKELAEVLRKHKLWLDDEDGGERADLRNADLRYADLRYADLRNADLRYANLSSANLDSADLRSADLRYANLSSANLDSADLRYADLRYADLIVVHLPLWTTYIGVKDTRIGCQHHKNADWLAFSDDEIDQMHHGALGWWRQWKPLIRLAMESLSSQKQEAS